AGQVKTSYFQNNFVPKTTVDDAGGSLPPVHSTLPFVQQPIPHHAAISNAPDFTFDYHQYSAVPALPLPVHHTERHLASTSRALLQSTSGIPHIVATQDYNADFSIPYITSYRNGFDDRNVTQDINYFDF
ncbi:hypothetical protein AGABI2DRAFT_184035, partial [Agaricus bisporus var. bisporus H97]|uniref:hypothetical protein n=1 Tax=Agaricus bisporus var. bisporus (strain H97 / ATCC MYA-4626 / FGSC 10389) TaxID=936046 RepID=UPI00029F5E8E